MQRKQKAKRKSKKKAQSNKNGEERDGHEVRYSNMPPLERDTDIVLGDESDIDTVHDGTGASDSDYNPDDEVIEASGSGQESEDDETGASGSDIEADDNGMFISCL